MIKIKKKKKKDNFMLYVPLKNHKEWIEKENSVYLIFNHDRKIERFASWLTNKPKVTDIELDDMGTKVWNLINGERSVYTIGQNLLDEYGKDCEPVYNRLIMYLRYLNKRGWIRFKAGHV